MGKVKNEISSSALIGVGTKVWRWSQVDDRAEIGENCIVGQCAYVGKDVKIGDNSRVMNGAMVSTGEIGKHVFIGPNVVITDNPMPRIAFPNKEKHRLKTVIGDGVSIGANATIIAGVTIGKNAFIAANTVVTRDVPNNALMAGAPAKQIRWICRCGQTFEQLASLADCHEG